MRAMRGEKVKKGYTEAIQYIERYQLRKFIMSSQGQLG